jgi:Zn-dependent protease with chaperone function
MSLPVRSCLVIAAVYAFTCLLFSIGVALGWHAGLERRRWRPGELLGLRLLPAGASAFLTFVVALPAFLIYEPRHEAEPAGPLLVAFALFALGAAGHGILRGWRAWAATRALLRSCRLVDRHPVTTGSAVDIVELSEPAAAVVGLWRPRILAADRVRAVCSEEEFRQVIAHEAAHVSAHDNVKLLLQIISPDALAWMPTGRALTERWRAATELAADAQASGCDPRKRVALASALVKVARLSSGPARRSPALSMPVALDDVECRVRELLVPLPLPQRPLPIRALVSCALMLAVFAVPIYRGVHDSIEALVAYGTSRDWLWDDLRVDAE